MPNEPQTTLSSLVSHFEKAVKWPYGIVLNDDLTKAVLYHLKALSEKDSDELAEELAQTIHAIYQHKNTQSSLCEVRNLLGLRIWEFIMTESGNMKKKAVSEWGRGFNAGILAAAGEGYVILPRKCPESVIMDIDLPIETSFGQSESERIEELYNDIISSVTESMK